jgi:hypothetical protein
MTLIVDDTVDVWVNDLANLCVTRRFVGDVLDDGLLGLSSQLQLAHKSFYAEEPIEGYSFDAPSASPLAPPSVFSVLADARGQLLRGVVVALTGIVNGLGHEDSLDELPLAVLIRLYGGETTTQLERATHLVARRKDGWQQSPKIRRALQRMQASHHTPSSPRALSHCTKPPPPSSPSPLAPSAGRPVATRCRRSARASVPPSMASPFSELCCLAQSSIRCFQRSEGPARRLSGVGDPRRFRDFAEDATRRQCARAVRRAHAHRAGRRGHRWRDPGFWRPRRPLPFMATRGSLGCEM